MFKRIALVLAVVMMFVMVANYVFAEDKPVQKEKSTCVMKDGKCEKKDAACCEKAKTTAAGCEKGKTGTAGCTKDQAQCPHMKETVKSACKESSCKASCPAQEACKAAEGEKK
jgi:hypothetical protein